MLIGIAYNWMGRYREGVDALKAAQANDPFVHLNLAYAYMELGREQDARAEAAEVIRRSPRFSLDALTKTYPGVWDRPERRHYLADLRKAGLK